MTSETDPDEAMYVATVYATISKMIQFLTSYTCAGVATGIFQNLATQLKIKN